ncbi:DMT family transporter [Nocardia noduli]|uniref:DMT family transporter n=1 Tax=Nocardia noduli TaxID=2815722 RepID=UPI001C23C74B|nr:DMT family transporter [Nocardia noduli]
MSESTRTAPDHSDHSNTATTAITYAVPATFVLAWSSAYIIGAIGIDSTPPFTLTFLRFALAALVMLAIAVGTRASWPRTLAEAGHIPVAGVLVQAVQFLGVFAGINAGVPPAISALVLGMNPVLTALLAHRFLGERTTARQRWGFALGVVGVVLAVANGLRWSTHIFTGIGFTVIAVLAISGGTVYQKRFCPSMDLRSGQALQLGASTVVAGLCAITFEHPHTTDPRTLGLSVTWLALVNSIGAVSLLYVMIRRGQAGRASSLFFLVPSVTAAMSALTLHQPLAALAIAGFAVSATGVALASFRSSHRPER